MFESLLNKTNRFSFYPRFILDPKNLKIRAGEWDSQTTKERLTFQERITGRIFTHPNYNEKSLAWDLVC